MKRPITLSFAAADEIQRQDKGVFKIIHLDGMTVGLSTYEPGWQWSTHVGPSANTLLCEVEQVGMVISGRAMAAMADGTTIDLTPGTLFYIPPGYDSWVVGNEPYISLQFMGTAD